MERIARFSHEKENHMVVGNKYTYIGQTQKQYNLIQGEDYTFMGVIKCTCHPNCPGFKGLFKEIPISYWGDRAEVMGFSMDDFLNERQMREAEKLLQ